MKSISTLGDTVLDRLYRLAEPQAGYFTTSQVCGVGVSRQELYYSRQGGDLLQALAAEQLQAFAEFPPRQKPGSFNPDAMLWQMDDAGGGGLH